MASLSIRHLPGVWTIIENTTGAGPQVSVPPAVVVKGRTGCCWLLWPSPLLPPTFSWGAHPSSHTTPSFSTHTWPRHSCSASGVAEPMTHGALNGQRSSCPEGRINVIWQCFVGQQAHRCYGAHRPHLGTQSQCQSSRAVPGHFRRQRAVTANRRRARLLHGDCPRRSINGSIHTGGNQWAKDQSLAGYRPAFTGDRPVRHWHQPIRHWGQTSQTWRALLASRSQSSGSIATSSTTHPGTLPDPSVTGDPTSNTARHCPSQHVP